MGQHVEPKVKLGPGFWPVTAGIGVLVALSVWWILVTPIANFLPEIAQPSDQIDALFKFLAVFSVAIFYYVVGYLIYFSIVFRRRRNEPADSIGIQIHDAPKLEFWWTVVPTILVIVLAIFSVRIWQGLQNSLGDVLTTEAVGYQFGFQFRYPRLKAPVPNELHLPVGTPVTLHVTSRDVIHGFWVPEVRLKADMVPGLINTLRFTPTQTGTFRIVCSEYCGVAHGNMVAKIVIQSQQDFGRWFAATEKQQGASAGGHGAGAPSVALASGVADKGKVLFGQKCSACHSLGPFDQKVVGPGLGNLMHDPAHPKLVNGTTPTPEHIAAILENGYQGPLGVMPTAQQNALSNADISNLTAYLASLK